MSSNMKIAHMGFVVFITGVLLSNRKKKQCTQIMRSGFEVRLGKQICCLRSIDQNIGPTFRSICGNLIIYQQPKRVLYNTVLNEIYKHIPLSRLHWGPAWSAGGIRSPTDSRSWINCQPHFVLKEQFAREIRARNSSTYFVTHKEREFREMSEDPHLLGASAARSPVLRPFIMFPEKRFYLSNQEVSTTKVAIHTNLLSDIYMLIGAGNSESGWFVTIMELPYIFFIWFGFVLAAVAGLKSLQMLLKQPKLFWL